MAALEELPETDIVHQLRRRSIQVNRPAFTELDFQEIHKENVREKEPLRARLSRFLGRQRCTTKNVKACLTTVFPILVWLPAYDIKRDLLGDCVSGLTVGIMKLPQGMAFGLLATLAPVYGLYTVFFPAVLYAMMGTSRHLSVGNFAVISIMTAASVDRVVEENRPLGGDEGLERATIAASLAFLVGMMQLGLGVLRLGFVSTYLAEPMVRGFTTGAAFHVFNSQFKYLFGIQVDRYNGPFAIYKTFIYLFANLRATNLAELIVALINLIAVVAMKELQDRYKEKFKYPIPLELLAIILTTMVSHFVSLEKNYGAEVVGNIPTGLIPPRLPSFYYMNSLITDAVVIAIVTFSVAVSMSYIFAKRNKYEIDANQELIALGSMSVFGSFFMCYPAASSLSCSLLQEMSGGKTQLASLLSCIFILVVLLFIGPLFYSLPKSCLAAIVVLALRGMFRQLKDIKVLWKYSKVDCMIWVVTWLSTMSLGVDYGLGVGVFFAIMTVIVRTQKPYCCLMGRIPGTDIYRDLEYYQSAKQVPGVKIFRMHSPLYYANADYVKAILYAKSGLDPIRILLARAKAESRRSKAESRRAKADARADARAGQAEETRRRWRKLGKKHSRLDEETEMSAMNLNETANNHHHREDADEGGAARNNGLDNGDRRLSMEVKSEDGTHSLVLDLGSVSFLDSVGVHALKSIIADYEKIGIVVIMAHCKENIREMLLKSGFMDEVGLDRMFVSLHDAIQHTVTEECVEDMVRQRLGHETNVHLIEMMRRGLPLPDSLQKH